MVIVVIVVESFAEKILSTPEVSGSNGKMTRMCNTWYSTACKAMHLMEALNNNGYHPPYFAFLRGWSCQADLGWKLIQRNDSADSSVRRLVRSMTVHWMKACLSGMSYIYHRGHLMQHRLLDWHLVYSSRCISVSQHRHTISRFDDGSAYRGSFLEYGLRRST